MAGMQPCCLASAAPAAAAFPVERRHLGTPAGGHGTGRDVFVSGPARSRCRHALSTTFRYRCPLVVVLATAGKPKGRAREGDSNSASVPPTEEALGGRKPAADMGFGALDSVALSEEYKARLELGRAKLGALSVDDYYFLTHEKQTPPDRLSGAHGLGFRSDEEAARRPDPLESSLQSRTFRRGTIPAVPLLRRTTASDRAARNFLGDLSDTAPLPPRGKPRGGKWRPADLGPRPGHDWPSAQAHIPKLEPQPTHSTGRVTVSSSSATLAQTERTFTAHVRQCMHAVQVGDLHTRVGKEMLGAVESYTDALQQHMAAAAVILIKRAESYAGLAAEQRKRGHPEQATASWDACLVDARAASDIDPKLELGYYYQGLALHHLGKAEDATAAFGRGLELQPQHEQLRAGLQAVHTGQDTPRDSPGGSAHL